MRISDWSSDVSLPISTTGQFHSLFQDPVAEVANTIWSSDESTLIGVVTAAGAPTVTLVDETHPDAQLYASLAASFPGQMVDFASHTEDGKLIVVSDRKSTRLNSSH